MKNLILILLCLCLTGCISSTVKRGINENENIYYSSSNPNIQLQFPLFFSYKKGGTEEMSHRFDYGATSIFVHFTPHPANETQVDYYYNPEKWMFSHVPISEKLNTGTLTILDKKWYYCNSVKKQGGSGYFIRNLGYFAPNHDRLYIRFTKDLSYADFQRLSDREFLTGEQASFIKEIIESFDSDIKITDFIQEEIPGTTPHVTAKLKLLKQSYEANLITKKEYEAKKNALLDAL